MKNVYSFLFELVCVLYMYFFVRNPQKYLLEFGLQPSSVDVGRAFILQKRILSMMYNIPSSQSCRELLKMVFMNK